MRVILTPISVIRDVAKGNFPLVGRDTDLSFHGSLHWFAVEQEKNFFADVPVFGFSL